ncbi:MAG TPA: acyltransferase [Puia sp.]|nr:acyltransferase [Puia sp.]
MLSSANYIEKEEYIQTLPAVKSSRLSWVDHARGIAIMLVVYRHSAVGIRRAGMGVSDFMYNVQEIFYNFRMPVFFVLSGIFIANSLKKKSARSVLWDRIATILYPYLLWGTIMILLQIAFTQFANSKRQWSDLLYIIIQPRKVDHLWYLLALFNTGALYLVLRKCVPLTMIHGVVALILHFASVSALFKDNSFLGDLSYYYCYFFAGTLVSEVALDKEKREAFLKPQHLKWLLPAFILGQWFWFTHRQDDKTFLFLFLVINLVACYFVYVISFKISHSSQHDWLAYLGKRSLYIYILHVFITSSMRNFVVRLDNSVNTGLLLVICWICGLVIPLLIYNLLKGFGFDLLFSLKQKKA